MALLHKASLTPSKLDLLSAYLPTVPGLSHVATPAFALLGAYRFDDPDGLVGIETHLVQTGSGTTLHIPLTYRNDPLVGAESSLVGTISHSVLGERWVYAASADPVYVSALLRTIATGGSQVEQYFEGADGREYREPTARVAGSGIADITLPVASATICEASGTDTHIVVGDVTVVVRHTVDESQPDASGVLSGTWSDVEDPIVLAYVR